MERLIDAHLKALLLNMLENCLEGVDDVTACKWLTGNTNHMAFLYCHLVDVPCARPSASGRCATETAAGR